MTSEQLTNEIREANLTYLVLAQKMLRLDRDTAMFRLGIGPDVAELLEKLTPAQVARMASSPMLLCRFRCDERLIAELLSGYGRSEALASAHANILMSRQPAAGLA